MVKNIDILVACVSILTVIAVGTVLKVAQSVILPFVIAWLLSYIFGPIVRFMTRKRIPTFLTVVLVLGVLLGACVLGAFFMNTRVSAFAAASPKYYNQFIDLTKKLTDSNLIPDQFWDSINWGERIGKYLLSLSGSLFNLLSKLVLVIIFLVFMLLGSPFVEYKIKKAFSTDASDRVISILKLSYITVSYKHDDWGMCMAFSLISEGRFFSDLGSYSFCS